MKTYLIALRSFVLGELAFKIPSYWEETEAFFRPLNCQRRSGIGGGEGHTNAVGTRVTCGLLGLAVQGWALGHELLFVTSQAIIFGHIREIICRFGFQNPKYLVETRACFSLLNCQTRSKKFILIQLERVTCSLLVHAVQGQAFGRGLLFVRSQVIIF